jgi:HAD superfamily hydrolase (TIGR01509 family)
MTAPLEAILLDVDGTLVDSNDAHAHAWVEALAEHGFECRFDEVRRLIGMGGDHVLPILTGLAEEEPRGEKIAERRSAIFRERHLKALKPFRDVRPLVEAMRRRGFRIVVATSARSDELDALLFVTGVEDLVDEKTTSSDAEATKPAPDIVAAAVRKAGVSPRSAIMIGDTPYDVRAAQRAGVSTIALRSGGWGDADLGGAIAIYDDAHDLLKHFDQSPLGRASHATAHARQG